jgi:glycosyltransferase involved in cell wall biosynthesis
MKIIMIAPQPFFEPRGTPISVYQRIAGLSKLGHTIDLVTYPIGQDVEFPGVRIDRAPRIPFIKELKVGPSWPKLPLDMVLFLKTISLLVKNKYDVIHSHEEAGIFAQPLAAIFHTRHLYDMHSSLPRQLVNFNFGNNRFFIAIFKWLERMVINHCDALITIGPDLEQHARSINSQVPQQMIENLPLKIKQTEGEKEKARQLKQTLGLNGNMAVVYTGTFERYQGVNLLIESAAVIREEHPNVRFLMVGGKPAQIEDLKQLVHSLHLEEQVHFTGTVSVDEANLYMEMADILVSPRIEGTSVPLKIYTYLRMGKPIMATNLPAHSLVLDDHTAVLVEPSLAGFVEGLTRLIEDEGLRNYLGQQSLKLANEKYSTANYLAKLEKIYAAVQPAPPSPEQPVEHIRIKD